MKTKVLWPLLAAVLIALAALPWIVSYFYIFIVTEILILGLFAASFNLIFGYTGMLSFGHAAFFGVGAYATALVLIHLQWPFLACLLVSMAAGALLSLIIGFFCVRLNEVYFAMLTLAFGMMVFAIAYQWRSVTNGSDGLAGFVLGSFGLGLDLTLGNPAVYYHVVLAVVVLASLLLYVICRSSFLGGTGYFLGPFVGSAVFVLLETLITSVTESWMLVLGVILALMVIFFRRGLLGTVLDWWLEDKK